MSSMIVSSLMSASFLAPCRLIASTDVGVSLLPSVMGVSLLPSVMGVFLLPSVMEVSLLLDVKSTTSRELELFSLYRALYRYTPLLFSAAVSISSTTFLW